MPEGCLGAAGSRPRADPSDGQLFGRERRDPGRSACSQDGALFHVLAGKLEATRGLCAGRQEHAQPAEEARGREGTSLRRALEALFVTVRAPGRPTSCSTIDAAITIHGEQEGRLRASMATYDSYLPAALHLLRPPARRQAAPRQHRRGRRRMKHVNDVARIVARKLASACSAATPSANAYLRPRPTRASVLAPDIVLRSRPRRVVGEGRAPARGANRRFRGDQPGQDDTVLRPRRDGKHKECQLGSPPHVVCRPAPVVRVDGLRAAQRVAPDRAPPHPGRCHLRHPPAKLLKIGPWSVVALEVRHGLGLSLAPTDALAWNAPSRDIGPTGRAIPPAPRHVPARARLDAT